MVCLSPVHILYELPLTRRFLYGIVMKKGSSLFVFETIKLIAQVIVAITSLGRFVLMLKEHKKSNHPDQG